MRYERHADEWQCGLALIGRDEREVVGECSRSNPEVVRWTSPAGCAQLAVPIRDAVTNVDGGRLREDRCQQPQPLRARDLVGRKQHTRLELADCDDTYNPRLVDLRPCATDQDARVDQRRQSIQGSRAAAASCSRMRCDSAAHPASAGASARIAASRSGAAGVKEPLSGPNSATGRPPTVIVKCSPRSARLSTSLIWLRNSR